MSIPSIELQTEELDVARIDDPEDVVSIHQCHGVLRIGLYTRVLRVSPLQIFAPLGELELPKGEGELRGHFLEEVMLLRVIEETRRAGDGDDSAV